MGLRKTHHPGISSSITYATLVQHPRHPRHPRWYTAHVSHIGAPPMSPTLACHPRQHTTNANTPPTLADLPRKHAFEHAISQTPEYPVSSQIPRENLAVFTFSFYLYNSLYFLGLLKHFHKSLENYHRKMKLFLEETSLHYSSDDYIFKNKCAVLLRKNCFLILVSFRSFCIF